MQVILNMESLMIYVVVAGSHSKYTYISERNARYVW